MRNIIVENGQTISEELAIKLINEGEYQLLPHIIEHYMPSIVATVK